MAIEEDPMPAPLTLAEQGMLERIQDWMAQAGALGLAREFEETSDSLGDLAGVLSVWSRKPREFQIADSRGHAGLNEYAAAAHKALAAWVAERVRLFRETLTAPLDDWNAEAFEKAEQVMAAWATAAIWQHHLLPALLARAQDEVGDPTDLALWQARGRAAASLIIETLELEL